ncbi:hypothetical protein BLA13014_04599 [Burkholderia aenigmatica]|uniref:Uncharacterized protein n=1 Tax=Burkholderia aenigmatica TaxID=2015348 RepID=A0A6P2NUN0_9BURK|nr:hypothetical protein [Burkholderia aenigmatica]VWB98303.1 hypothetical protein BLA13014_04599 [Burkholderia aenigmatica]
MNAVAERVDHADDCRLSSILEFETSDREVEHLESPPKADKVAHGEFEVDVTKEKVIVAGVGLLAIYHWETSNWGKKIKRLSVERSQADSDNTAQDRYRVVAESSDDSGGKSEVFVNNLSEAEAKVVLKKIELGIKEILGVSALGVHTLEIPCDDGSVVTIASSRALNSKPVLAFLNAALKVVACCVVAFGVLSAWTYFVYDAGQQNGRVRAITERAPGPILPPLLPQVATPQSEAEDDVTEPPTEIQTPKEALAPATRAINKRDRR